MSYQVIFHREKVIVDNFSIGETENPPMKNHFFLAIMSPSRRGRSTFSTLESLLIL